MLVNINGVWRCAIHQVYSKLAITISVHWQTQESCTLGHLTWWKNRSDILIDEMPVTICAWSSYMSEKDASSITSPIVVPTFSMQMPHVPTIVIHEQSQYYEINLLKYWSLSIPWWGNWTFLEVRYDYRSHVSCLLLRLRALILPWEKWGATYHMLCLR